MTSRRVLVTGGGSGIGLAAARAIAATGARVVIADVDIDQVPDDAPAIRIRADVSSEEDVARMFAEALSGLGGLDVVVHSAGIIRERQRDIREITLESWQKVISVNLTGAFLVAREAVRVLVPEQGAAIILVGSGAGTIGPSGSIPYGASKGGVNGLAMTLAAFMEPFGIRVHNFLPGRVDTPLLQGALNEAITNGADPVSIEVSRRRLTDAASVARVLAFLASEDAAALKGNVGTQ